VKTWDAIIVGGGIIGLSLGLSLRRRGLRTLVVDRSELGREASYAAGGMLADCLLETPSALQPLARASARMYPEFVHELEHDSGLKVDLRQHGTILFPEHPLPAAFLAEHPLPAPLSQLEPALAASTRQVCFLEERSVDPRDLLRAAIKAIKLLEVDTSAGDTVTSVDASEGRITGITTTKTSFSAPVVVNCAGAWASQLGDHSFPTRPVKGQMLAVVGEKEIVRHVIRAPDAYIIPRSDGRVVIGATLEEAGYDKRTDPEAIQRLRQGALSLVPRLAEARILEAWAGLRPGTPDNLPILGRTSTGGYFVATGHFRDGILLAPVTAQLMTQLICDNMSQYDISAFSPARFAPPCP
jgi:glycine oxidase